MRDSQAEAGRITAGPASAGRWQGQWEWDSDAVDQGGEAVRLPVVGGRPGDRRAGGQEDGLGDAHQFLVGDELFVRSLKVADMLVDVDDAEEGRRFFRDGLPACAPGESCARGAKGGGAEKVSAG